MDDFLETLDLLGAPVFPAQPGGRIKGYALPARWPEFTPDGNDARLARAGESCGYGMVTGAVYSVIDIDPRNGGSVEYLITRRLVPEIRHVVQTPGGGWHIYVDRLGTGKFTLPGIDVQDLGSFVFAPPTPDYRLLTEEEWPAGLADAQDPAALGRLRGLRPVSRPVTPSAEGEPLDIFNALERLDGVYRAMAETPHGERNNTLTKPQSTDGAGG